MKPCKQCKKCPWKVGTTPQDIPGGYCETRHRALKSTIAEPGTMSGFAGPMMACHEATVGSELPCVGWLVQQIGDGNNIALRLRVITGEVDGNVETVGPQHARLEDTFPKRRRK